MIAANSDDFSGCSSSKGGSELISLDDVGGKPGSWRLRTYTFQI